MIAGELELRLTGRGADVRVCERPGNALERALWTPAERVPLREGLFRIHVHHGPVRVSLSVDDVAGAEAAIAAQTRPDALFVFSTHRQSETTPLSLPVTIENLAGRQNLFDPFTRSVEGRDLIREIPPTPFASATSHVIHTSASRKWFPAHAAQPRPRLVVVEIVSPIDDVGSAADVMADLSSHGVPAAIVLIGATEAELGAAARLLYRKLAHDRDLDDIARELLHEGHRVVLMLAEDAERCLIRRAAFETPRSGVRASTVLVEPERKPRTELEKLLSEAAVEARAGLAHVAVRLANLRFDEEFHAVSAVQDAALQLDQIAASPAANAWWRLHQPRSSGLEPLESLSAMTDAMRMPPRNLQSFLHRDGIQVAHGVLAGERIGLDVSIVFASGSAFLRVPGYDVPISARTLRDVFGDRASIEIDVVVWTDPDSVKVEYEQARLTLPRMGEAPPTRFYLVPMRPGVARARVALYHHNRVLQSMMIDLSVAATASDVESAPAPQVRLDYAASEELLGVDSGPAPALSIFINQAPDGTHWVGVRTSDDASAHGIPVALDDDDCKKAADTVHAALREASELDEADRYGLPLRDISPGDRASREERLVALARAGHDLHTLLFAGGGGKIRRAVAAPNRDIEVARMRGDAPSLPWQAVYDLYVEPNGPVALCPTYLAQIDVQNDLLDDPQACASQASCPHRKTLGDGQEPAPGAPDSARTVCPFGFWGVRQRIAQPLATKKIAEATTDRPASSSVGGCVGDPGVTVGYFEFEHAADHIARLAPTAATKNRTELRTYLKSRSDAVIYFFCHGEGEGTKFVLKIGTAADDPHQYVSAGDLTEIGEWQHAPIVVLNGCQTLQVQPDKLNLLLGVLRELGASAVIGPEIAMFTSSAAAVGELLIAGIFDRVPLDELMLRIRRSLLRELSPMGLAYNVYAPSGLVWSPPQGPDSSIP